MLKRFGADQLYRGGLRIYTTLDPDLQRAAEDAVADRISALEATKAYKRRDHQEPLEAGLVSIDPMNGYVLALVGGRDFHESRFNRATQARRQPGSAFKPLLFAAALEQGNSPGTVIGNLTTALRQWVARGCRATAMATLRPTRCAAPSPCRAIERPRS